MTEKGRRQNNSNVYSDLSVIESSDMTSGMVLGDTGDHHFPKSQINSERNPIDEGTKINSEMFLSEIAEEDSTSMISERLQGNTMKHKQLVRQSIISMHSNIVKKQQEVDGDNFTNAMAKAEVGVSYPEN